ncbi:MAG: hypothetical protein AAGF11_25155 [Myxococcota bacterium]
MRWSLLLISVVGALCTRTSVAAAAENPLARRSSTEEWDAELRRLKIATGVWWGTFAALNISGIPTCVIASRDLNEGAAAWCAIASIGSAVTMVGGIVYSVRLLRHNEVPKPQRYCWPNCRVGRVRWEPRRPLALRF